MSRGRGPAPARIAWVYDLNACRSPTGVTRHALAQLDELVAAHPMRERPVALLLDALDAEGRTADALQAYERYRRTLADELGVDPSPAAADPSCNL